MTRNIVDAEIKVYAPGASTPKKTIENDIESVSISERISDAKDSGSISLDNTDGSHNDITAGDRLVFRTQLQGEKSLSDRHTGLARSPTDVLAGGRIKDRDIDIVDFVFGVLADRIAFENFEERQIAGSSDSIVETLLSDEADEIGRGQIDTVSETTDAFIDGRTLYSVICEDLAAIADAVVTQDGTDIIFRPMTNVSVSTGLTPDDFRAPIDISRNDDNLVNLVRVSGGTDHDVDDSQTTQSSTTTVTNSTRITTQIQTRKSQVARIAIHTDPDPNSTDNLRVRLQATRSGAAVNVSDTSSDIARRELAPAFLEDGGFTDFILPNHELAPAEDPTIIVEATGSTGHPVGTDGSGNLTYKSKYPFPLLTRSVDEQSLNEYRRRDRRLQDEQLQTFDAVRDKAQSIVERRAQPEITVEAEADSLSAHNVGTGDGVTLTEFSVDDANGTFVCRERTTEYDGTTLHTTLLLQDIATL